MSLRAARHVPAPADRQDHDSIGTPPGRGRGAPPARAASRRDDWTLSRSPGPAKRRPPGAVRQRDCNAPRAPGRL